MGWRILDTETDTVVYESVKFGSHEAAAKHARWLNEEADRAAVSDTGSA